MSKSTNQHNKAPVNRGGGGRAQCTANFAQDANILLQGRYTWNITSQSILKMAQDMWHHGFKLTFSAKFSVLALRL